MRRFGMAVAVASLLAAPAGATEDAGARTHDGFMLHVAVGPSFTTSQAGDGPDLGHQGLGAALTVRVGGRVFGDLLLHAGLVVRSEEAAWYDADRDVPIAPACPPPLCPAEQVPLEDQELEISAISAGATWYLMPSNLYFGASLLARTAGLFQDDDHRVAFRMDERGFGLEVHAGKEWWVHEEWGVGAGVSWVRATLDFESAGDPVAGRSGLTSDALALLLTATYN